MALVSPLPPSTLPAGLAPVNERTLDRLDVGVVGPEGDCRNTEEAFAEGAKDEDLDDVRDPVGDGLPEVAEADNAPKL